MGPGDSKDCPCVPENTTGWQVISLHESVRPYVSFAQIYDRVMADVPYRRWFQYISAIWERFSFTPRRILDLACGTGNFSVLLAKQGYEVVGLDASAHMLDVAREKVRNLGLSAEFVHADMRDFVLPEPVDGAVCLFDSLNYLLELNDIRCAFRCVHRCLRPGGLFVFDVNTPERLASIPSETTVFEGSDYFLVWSDIWDPDNRWWQVNLTGFIRKGNTWERFDEIHKERAFPIEDLSRLLRETGFSVLAVYDSGSFKPASSFTARAYFVARKGPTISAV